MANKADSAIMKCRKGLNISIMHFIKLLTLGAVNTSQSINTAAKIYSEVKVSRAENEIVSAPLGFLDGA